MKKFYSLFLLLITLISFQSNGQKLDYDRTSPWFFGTNVGATWQHTDVSNKTNYGWGLVLGRSFGRNYGRALSFDVKLRYLGGAWRGQNGIKSDFSDYENLALSSEPTDYKTNYGYSINNFQTKNHELNLELSMHFNRLTERTGFDPYLFVGLGASFYRAKGDLLDDQEFMYDYNLLSDVSKSEAYSYRDKNYESDLDGSQNRINGKIMPHVGFGLGYYFTPNVSLGFEHKTTFTGGDNFDGVVSNHGKYKQDIYHYTSLYLKVYFNRAKATRDQHDTPPSTHNPVNPSTPVVPPTTSNDCINPVVILNTSSNLTVSQPDFQLTGSIRNSSIANITSTLNGIQTGNLVYGNNQSFSGNYYLQPGINTIVLTASNECGLDTETIQVNYVPACETPTVQFTIPRTNTVSTTSPSYSIQAQVNHLGNGLIQFYINGQQSTNFNYNASTGVLSSTLSLQNGNNTVQIIASNNCGSNTQNVTISFDKVCPPPVINAGNQNNTVVNSAQVELVTNINNITNANQVEVFINGRAQSNGIYNASTHRFSKNLTLSRGNNQVVVRATNSCGTVESVWEYDYREPCINPTVVINNPSGPRVTSTVNNYVIQAKLDNVSNPQNITFKVNGQAITNFHYNVQTGLFTANITLDKGSNFIELNASNDCGYASAASTISYTPPCETAVITWKVPTSNTSSKVASFPIEAHITNINNANNVTLSVNGTVQSVGTYNPATKLYSAIVTLQKGNNTIRIIASNNCGEVTSSTSVTYKEDVVVVGQKPEINFTNNCNVKLDAGRIVFSGTVTGVTNTSQIQVKLQNIIHNEVTYTPIVNGFRFYVQLNVGYSQVITMEVSAANHIQTTTQRCQITTEDAPVIDRDIEICHTINGVKQTMTIKESQWANYQRMGATLGKCPEVVYNDITICLKETTLTIKENLWPNYEQMGAIKGACPEAVDNDIIICLPKGKEKVTMTIKESQWADYQKLGATLGECPEIIDNDIIICVLEGRVRVTRTIKESQWPQYQQMGATLGECPIYDPELEICVRNGNTLKTITIKESEWPAYQAQGAFIGKCPEVLDPEITICLPNENGQFQTLIIKQSQWEQYKERGATIGTCRQVEDPKMDICVPNGKTYTNLTIQASLWPEYEKIGATKGKCPEVVDNDVKICITEGKLRVTKTIKESQLEAYLQMGATLGECPVIVDNDITICILENGVYTTKTIKESEWPKFKESGATLGKCPEIIDNDIEICVLQGRTKVTRTIKESEWPRYQAQGATLGKCPQVVDKDMIICVPQNGQNVTMTIKESQWADYLKLGATQGKCREIVIDKEIEICVLQGRVKITRTIKESEWPIFEAIGATRGACPTYDPDVIICALENGLRVTKTIKESQWAEYQANGAELGPCVVPPHEENEEVDVQDDQFLICVEENGQFVTKTIRITEWNRYQRMGATRGACVDTGNKTTGPQTTPSGVIDQIKGALGGKVTPNTKPTTKPGTTVKPGQQKPTTTRPVESKPSGTRPTGTRPTNSRPASGGGR